MVFCVVEVKENDLYTIYDTENGGVCCCTGYTLKQLLQMGHTVSGAICKNGKIKVIEVGLDGKPRSKKAPVICEDVTKRSASTIVKGLDVKRYPRVKQNRSGWRGMYAPGTVFKVYSEQDGRNEIGVLLSDYTIIGDGAIRYTEAHIQECNLKIEPTQVDEAVRTRLMQVYNAYNRFDTLKAEITACEVALEKQKQQLAQLYKEKAVVLNELKCWVLSNGVTG